MKDKVQGGNGKEKNKTTRTSNKWLENKKNGMEERGSKMQQIYKKKTTNVGKNKRNSCH